MISTNQLTPAKAYWLREEICIADELLSYQKKLTEEFLDRHDDFVNGAFVKGKPYKNPTFNTNDFQSRAESWKVDALKYNLVQDDFTYSKDFTKDKGKELPTAAYLTQKYGDECSISTYSIIEANSVIERHTGIENRDREYLRIHVPLIVPEGDIFFECEGVEIDWSDIFGFDNQLIHSAHNYSNFRRLIFLIDIRRSYLGIPIGEKYDQRRERLVPPFVRGLLPKVLHTCQK